jgi:hypothetical protein
LAFSAEGVAASLAGLVGFTATGAFGAVGFLAVGRTEGAFGAAGFLAVVFGATGALGRREVFRAVATLFMVYPFDLWFVSCGSLLWPI